MKYILTKKVTKTSPAEELLNEEFVTADEIIPKVKAIFAKGYKLEEVETRIEDGEPASVAEVMAAVNLPKTRKTRADKGQSHERKATKRRRTVYHLVNEVTTYESKEKLDEALSTIEHLGNRKVIDGGSVRSIECQRRYVLG